MVKIAIDPITRIEGHLRIEAQIGSGEVFYTSSCLRLGISGVSLLGIRSPSLRLNGVQPLSLEPGIGLSGLVAGRVEALIGAVLETLNDWHVTASPR
jgi:hypothetical protein